MTTATLGALLDRRAERDEGEETRDALRAPGNPERRYTAPRLLTDAKKTGNFLRQLGVGPGRTVAIADVPTPESVLTLFGAALLGAPIRFVPVNASEPEVVSDEGLKTVDARVLVGPVDRLADLPVNVSKRIAYGSAPSEPEIAYFERDVWSENPTFPPGGPSEEEIAIETDDRKYVHREAVQAARGIVETRSLDPGTEIAVRAPLSDPRVVVAGLLAPLACGGVVLCPDAESVGDVAVVAADSERSVPEPTTIDAEGVLLADV